MARSGAANQAWVKTDPLAPHLELWWSKLLPAQQAAALADPFTTLPEWVAQSLLRAGVPLSIDPGFNSGATAGNFSIPPEFHQFMAQKRAAPRRRWWFRRRDKS